MIFAKYSGAMGESGSVSFMFDYVGQIRYPGKAASEDAMFEAAIDAGADNCEFDGNAHIITCASGQFGSVRDALEKKFGQPESARLTWLPKTTTPVNEEQARQLLKLIDALEDNDDVQEVFSNFEIPESLLTALSA
jgi:transcriptional/translational regulatory protein YebC/TACO1